MRNAHRKIHGWAAWHAHLPEMSDARKEVAVFQLNLSEVTVPVLLIWGTGVGAFIIAFFLGNFSSRLRADEKMEAAEAKVEVMRAEAEKKLAEAEMLKSQAPRVVDDPGLLRLKNKDGRPVLEMNGVSLDVRNVSPDQKKRLI